MATLRAVVVGGTGALGRFLLGELVSSPAFSEVISLGRREATIPETFQITDAQMRKLKQVIVDFDLETFTLENNKSHFEDKDVFFCALGTTRSVASRQPGNTAENFRRIDLHLVVRCAEIAKAAGVRHVSLVSSVGANANSWFLYTKTKGQAENEVEAIGFERTSIWRPGLLDRGADARLAEKFLKIFATPMALGDVACGMTTEAVQWAFKTTAFPPVSRYNNAAIRDFVRQSKQSEVNAADNPSVPAAATEGDGTGESSEGQDADRTAKDDAITTEQATELEIEPKPSDNEEPKAV